MANLNEQARDLLPPHQIVAESQAMRELLQFVQRVALSKASAFLVEGENGTGKDLVARMLHDLSPRRAGPFLAINCSAIPETLLESELFGYEKGAFTDARGQKRGLFELANQGTLFLDEIGTIAQPLQAKLLRVLENQAFRRLGGLQELEVDIRIIAATNVSLHRAVLRRAFRQDLYYRLNIIQVNIPPLRERLEDVLPLTHFFVSHYNHKFHCDIRGVTDEASSILLAHHWPGNVRELRNAIERAMILEDTERIRPQSLPAEVRDGSCPGKEPSSLTPGAFNEQSFSLRSHERRLVIQALEKTEWNQTQAANLLRISRDALRYKMKKFRLLRIANQELPSLE